MVTRFGLRVCPFGQVFGVGSIHVFPRRISLIGSLSRQAIVRAATFTMPAGRYLMFSASIVRAVRSPAFHEIVHGLSDIRGDDPVGGLGK